MNKFAIPTILLATVMVAGMFAFSPVEQVTTVHTGEIASSVQHKMDSVTCTSTGINDDCLITISSNQDYLVMDISTARQLAKCLELAIDDIICQKKDKKEESE